jgi:hypothetical protein
MQNSSVAMSKEAYFEMCEALGNQPKDDEVPVEFEDFPLEVQQALIAYRMLRDEWDSMNGIYLGKSLIGIQEVLEATEIDQEDRKFITMLVRTIDGVRIQEINNKQKTEKPAK